MASANHMNIEQSQASGRALYGEGNTEHFGYAPIFPGGGGGAAAAGTAATTAAAAAAPHGFDHDWNIDPSLSAMDAHDSSPFAPLQSWSQAPAAHQPQPRAQQQQRSHAHAHAPQQQQQHQHHQHQPYHAADNFYASAYSSNPTPFPTSPYAYAGHGIGFGSYSDPTSNPNNPNLLAATAAHQTGTFSANAPFRSSASAVQATVAPAALQTAVESGSQGQLYNASNRLPQPTYGPSVVLPKGVATDRFVLIDGGDLGKATKSTQFYNFLHLGAEEHEYPVQKRKCHTQKDSKPTNSTVTSAPAYTQRKSRSEISKLAVDDPKICAKLSKKGAKVTKTKAPKIPRPRLPLAKSVSGQVSTPSSLDSTSSDEDSDYSSSDDELDIVESPPLPPSRPEGALEAVKYDTIKAVWFARRLQPSSDQIRAGLKNVWEVLSTLRDRWMSDRDALETATAAQKHSELPMLRDRVKSQRDMFEVALSAALEHGHPKILSLMSEIRPYIQMCRLFLNDRVKSKMFNDPLCTAILESLRRCSTLTKEVLEKAKLEKVLPKYETHGSDATKKLVRQIEENAKTASKAQAEKSQQDKATEQKGSDVKAKPGVSSAARLKPTPTPEPVAGVKRPQPGDAPNSPAKRVASIGTSAVKLSTTAKKAPAPTVTGKAVVPPAKAKTPALSKTPNMYAGLKSVPKRSELAASSSTKPTAASAPAQKSSAPTQKPPVPVKKPPVPAAPPPVVATSSAFSNAMLEISKSKEPERPKKEQEKERPLETEEEKAKRLRKESRRKLHVRFKDGPTLVSIRYFHHEADEDTGRDANMIRDAADVLDEGRMFKQLQHQNNITIEDDEDAADNNASSFVDFKPPSMVDFNAFPEVTRQENYARFGGAYKTPDSADRAVQEQRERFSLNVHYLERSDIPPTPREPTNPFTGEQLPFTEFSSECNSFVHERAAQAQSTGAATGAKADIAAILSGLAAKSQPQAAPQAPASTGNPLENLQKILAQFVPSTQPAPQPTPQPQPQAAPQPAHQPASAPDVSSLLASLRAFAPASASQPPAVPQFPSMYQPQQTAAQPMQMPQVPNMFASSGSSTNLSALMSSLSQHAAPQQAAAPPTAPAMQRQGSDDAARKRQRDGGEADDQSGSKRGKWGGKKRGFGGEKPKFVLPCKFFKEGKCLKGANCTYLHK